MEYKYNILFTLGIMLGDNPSRDFMISPTINTTQTMRNLGMVFRERQDNSFVAAAYLINDQQINTVLHPVAGVQKFTFLIVMKDSAFLEHADLQNEGEDTNRIGRRIYYFSNLDHANAIDGNINGKILSLSENAQVSAADMWSVIPAGFSFPVNAAEYSEIDLYRIAPSQPDVKLPSIFKMGMTKAALLLNGYDAGAYRLQWTGTPARTEMIYSDNDLVRKEFFALAEIYKDPRVNNDILDNKTISYSITFKQQA